MKSNRNIVDFTGLANFHIACLKLLGLWFFTTYSTKSYKFWLFAINRVVTIVIVYIIPTIGQVIYLIKLIIAGNASVKDAAGMLNLVFAEILCTIKFLDMHLRRYSLITVLKELNCKEFHTTNPTHVEMLTKGVALSRKMFNILIISSMSDICVHIIVVPAMHKFSTTPVNMDFLFFDVEEPRFFAFICVYQILYKILMVACFGIQQSLTWSCLKCVICQLDVLIDKIKNIEVLVKDTITSTGCNENEAFKVVFYDCVCHYQAIIRYTKAMQAGFTGQWSATLFLSACVIGNTAVQMFSIESPLNNMTEVTWTMAFLSIMVLNLFVDCYFGNTVTYKSAAISTIVFGSPWITLSQEVKRNVAIFIAFSQQPIKLTAANLVPVSIPTFTTVMNWTYKGFAIMNQMK